MFAPSVANDMEIREMSDHEAVELGGERLEPGLVPGDFDPIRLEEEDISEEQEDGANKKYGSAAGQPPEPHAHERSNRPSCNSSARVKGIG